LPDVAAFCPECGTPTRNALAFPPPANPVDQPYPAPPAGSDPEHDPEIDLMEGYFGPDKDGALAAAWITSMPFFKNSVMVKYLWWFLGLPVCLCWAVLVWHALTFPKPVIIGVYVLTAITAVVAVSILITAALHGWKYEELYTLGSEGAVRRFTGKTGGRIETLTDGTLLGGILSGNLTMAASSMLAASQITSALRWEHIRKVVYRPGPLGKGYVYLYGTFGHPGIILFTRPETFERAAAVVRHYTKHVKNIRVI